MKSRWKSDENITEQCLYIQPNTHIFLYNCVKVTVKIYVFFTSTSKITPKIEQKSSLAQPRPDRICYVMHCMEKVCDLEFHGHASMVTKHNFDFWNRQPFQHKFEKKSSCYSVLEMIDFPSWGNKNTPFTVDVVNIGSNSTYKHNAC